MLISESSHRFALESFLDIQVWIPNYTLLQLINTINAHPSQIESSKKAD